MRTWILALLALTVAASAIAGPPRHRPPEHRPPDRGAVDVRNDARAGARSSASSDATAQARSRATGGSASVGDVRSGDSQASAAGGDGGAGGSAHAQAGDASAAGGSATSGGNSFDGGDNENNVFALSVGAPNISGCIVGGSVGGGGDGGGGLFQWGRLNHDCFMNEMADAERHIGTRARLKCASRHYRNAVTFDFKGNRVERTQACVDYTTSVWEQEIDYLRELVAAEIGEAPGK